MDIGSPHVTTADGHGGALADVVHSRTPSMVDPPDSGLGGPRGGSNVTSALGDSPLVARVNSPPVRGCVGSCVAG